MKNMIFSIILFSLIPVFAFAGKYGMAGCGLGSIVIKSNGIMQVAAATTNGTSASQTFGITSGTSNCTTDGVVQASKEREAFVDASKEELMSNISAGEGEYLTTLATLYSCNEDVMSDFNKVAQDNYEAIMNLDSAADILNALENKLSENSSIVKGCAVL